MTAVPVEPRRAKQGAGVTAAALALACGMIAAHEGMIPTPYVDRLGKGQPLTVCYGETHGVIPGKRYTPAECRAMLEISALDHAVEAQACLPYGLPAKTAAAFYDISYNIGARAFCKSSIARKAAAGDLHGACKAVLLYRFSNGRDCSIRSNKCGGVWRRRQDEAALCLEGLA